MRSRYTPPDLNQSQNNPEHYKWGLFYFNPDDNRIIVPKRNPWMGWTLNFANLWTYVILGVFIVVAVIVAYFAE